MYKNASKIRSELRESMLTLQSEIFQLWAHLETGESVFPKTGVFKIIKETSLRSPHQESEKGQHWQQSLVPTSDVAEAQSVEGN